MKNTHPKMNTNLNVMTVPISILVKTLYTEHIKALTQSLIKLNFVEHTSIFSTHHTYTSIETNLEILSILLKDSKLNTTEKYEIYKHYKQSPTNIQNDHLHYITHTFFDTITHTSHTTSLLSQPP